MAFLPSRLTPRSQATHPPFDSSASISPLGLLLGEKQWEIRANVRAKLFDYESTMKRMSGLQCKDVIPIEELFNIMSENAKIVGIEDLLLHIQTMCLGDVIRAFRTMWIIVELKESNKIHVAKVIDQVAPVAATQVLRERGGDHYQDVEDIAYYVYDDVKYHLYKSQDVGNTIFVNGIRVLR